MMPHTILSDGILRFDEMIEVHGERDELFVAQQALLGNLGIELKLANNMRTPT